VKRLAMAGTASQAELAKAAADVRLTARPGVSGSARKRIAMILVAVLCQLNDHWMAAADRDIAAPGLGPPVGRDGARHLVSETAPPVLTWPHRATLTAPISDRNLNDTFF
jgi:hypothetical protein